MSNHSLRGWKKLDNAAKIFPPTASKRAAKVFRCSCELYEPIDKEILKDALDSTLIHFPIYRYVLKRGFFWYYLEESLMEAKVKEEDTFPCATLYTKELKTFLFEVSYYKKRINLEVFHVLSDGTGALQFLRTLTCYYLKYRYKEELKNIDPVFSYDATDSQKLDDSFSKYYRGKRSSDKIKAPTAYIIRGPIESESSTKIIEGSVNVHKITAKAKEYNTTVTTLITAIMMTAIHNGMTTQNEKKPVVIAVPVNLRNFFKSESIRNFFGLIFVNYRYEDMPGDFYSVLRHIDRCFREELTVENLAKRIDVMGTLERNRFLQFMPLATKDLTLSIANEISTRRSTASLSNLGIIKMPPEVKPYIRLFDIFFPTDKLQLCICSYEDNMNISITSPFVNTDIQKDIFRMLRKMDIDVEISSNRLDERQLKMDKSGRSK